MEGVWISSGIYFHFYVLEYLEFFWSYCHVLTFKKNNTFTIDTLMACVCVCVYLCVLKYSYRNFFFMDQTFTNPQSRKLGFWFNLPLMLNLIWAPFIKTPLIPVSLNLRHLTFIFITKEVILPEKIQSVVESRVMCL